MCQLHKVNSWCLMVMFGHSARGWTEWGSCGLTCGTSKRSRVRPACVPTVGRPACGDDELEPSVQISLCILPLCPCMLHILLSFYIFIAFLRAALAHEK